MANPSKRNSPLKNQVVGDAEFNNTKRIDLPTGGSSATKYKTDKFGSDLYSSETEPARQSRLGKSQTPSGPKSRDFPFFKHTTKGK